MGILEIILLGIGLSMDAFAVSICKGACVKEMKIRYPLLCGFFFGGFQALMPAIGYYVGAFFSRALQTVGSGIACIVLVFIGIKMIKEASDPMEGDANFSILTMILLAIATSIDALAVGVSLALVGADIYVAAPIIGFITFWFGFGGVYIGHFFGSRYRTPAERVGGIVLILIGLRIVLSHLLG